MNKKKIQKLLISLQKMDQKEFTTEGGSLDIKKFNENLQIIKVKEELKKLGVKNNKELLALGFVGAGMVLRF